MSKTTITRGNILAATIVQVPLPSTTIAGTTTDVTLTVPGVQPNDFIQAQFDAALVTGISIGNAYTNTANQVVVRLVNSTGASATQTAGTLLLKINTCEDSPIPSNVV
jgi:hypothetical protein